MRRLWFLTAAVWLMFPQWTSGLGETLEPGEAGERRRYVSVGLLEPDKLVSAWLIIRHVDPGAVVELLPADSELPENAVPFDVPGVRWARHAVQPTYEKILESEKITDPALVRIGRLVRASELASWSLDPESAEGRFDRKIKEFAMNDDLEGAYAFLDVLYQTGGSFPTLEE